MALVLKDRVKESSTTSGTGTITLGGAFVGFQTFNTAIASGSTVYYTIHNTTAGNDQEWEVGVGTFTAPDQLTRDTVFSSSTGGSKVSFTGSSVLEVFITQPAEQAVYINDATGKVEVFGNGTNVVAFTEINTTNLTANTVTLTSGTISTNAANATDITNKQYVDGLVLSGTHFHEPVLVEEDVALDAVYVQPNGASNGVGATLTNNGSNVALVIDGVSVSNTARVLVYAQANAVQNGVYTVTNPGAPDSPGPGVKWVLTRSTDTDTFGLASSTQLSEGSTFFVQDGDTGAGRTYTCNTQGTITFGSSNITFVQISSAQIYSAGTGLNLANLTFSIANTAVTAATYDGAGNTVSLTVNAQGQLTNVASVPINASSISVGTLSNDRTTANSANGASTIVARDTNGSFTANVITATDVNSTNVTATTGSFTNISGNAATATNINASNISSGTLDNARTTGNTANSASTLVLRDSNGSFGANIISASFSGDGSAINAINASNISSGTIDNSRTTAASANGASTIVLRDSGGNFSANTITANISGDISGGTNINASNITSGTIANARTTASSSNGASTIVLRGASGEFAAGAITGASFSGNGASITAINASAITTGTLDNARTTAASANGASTIVARDAGGNFSANTITATTGSFTSVSGNGVALTDINASNISSGTIANARTTAASANGANTIVSRDANGSFSANIVTATFTGNGATLTDINASNITSGTISNARTTAATANGASTIVLRGTSGEFTAGAITGASFTGDGAAISAINGSNVTTGTVANARTTAASANGASTIVARDANGSFTANVGTFTTVSGAGGGLTGINASNISTGTIANARTTAASANGASTIVARGASGEFSAGIITADGSGLSAINGSNVTTGTVANARTTASDANGASTIVSRDANGSFSANVVTATFSGNGSSISAINASNISSGTIANARTTAATANGASTIVLRGTSGEFTAGAITGASFTGDGTAISNVNASNLTAGTVASARISGSYTGITGVGTLTVGTWNANSISTTYTDAKVTSATAVAGTGINVSSITTTGAATHTITNTGVTSAVAGTGVSVSGGTGAVTFSIGQAVATSSNVQFNSLGVNTAGSGTAGEIRATNNITAFYSDERLKTKTGNIENALDKVCQIETMLYHANETAVALGYDASIPEVGVTAQSVQKVQPEIVVPAPIDDKYLTVRYEKLVPLLIEAIKELKAEVDALKGK
jgi:hypothetical protein